MLLYINYRINNRLLFSQIRYPRDYIRERFIKVSFCSSGNCFKAHRPCRDQIKKRKKRKKRKKIPDNAGFSFNNSRNKLRVLVYRSWVTVWIKTGEHRVFKLFIFERRRCIIAERPDII